MWSICGEFWERKSMFMWNNKREFPSVDCFICSVCAYVWICTILYSDHRDEEMWMWQRERAYVCMRYVRLLAACIYARWSFSLLPLSPRSFSSFLCHHQHYFEFVYRKRINWTVYIIRIRFEWTKFAIFQAPLDSVEQLSKMSEKVFRTSSFDK